MNYHAFGGGSQKASDSEIVPSLLFVREDVVDGPNDPKVK
jgi:hypothetical protein